ncbi:hypothetical protein EJ08DRAFT_602057 [Tothia fuscella]|uniref:Thiolase-like protein type 1 additional C-terminal domain-containing protein n=1 Tax=Tothia fuscella TaxID=1048955 RepID=A0A9P4P591_9PEZI|nr:hypothetical protein EJ08DRAFT_602057 [Tothia fuscella]
MPASRLTPIIVGVGDCVNTSQKVEDAIEPAELMLRAIEIAIKDTNLPESVISRLREEIDSIDVVKTWTWPYPDLPGLLAEKLGARPSHKEYSDHGGNKPVKFLDEAARRISLGKSKVAIITGGEALASLSACAKEKKLPPPGWSKPAQAVDSVFSPTNSGVSRSDLATIHDVGAPIHIYPLYENGFRKYRGQTLQQNNQESATLYAEFAQTASKNPYAWNYGKSAETEESIGRVSSKNRMICFPYPLLMNAFNTVNLAGACLLTSTAYAQELGIPEDRWIYPLGGAGTQDANNFWERPDFHSSPSISRSIDAALKVSGLSKEDIDLYDFYSCFPIVPKIASYHLGLPIVNSPKPITLLGGLTSFGGAGNNYSMHAITEMTRQLRVDAGQRGLVLANGGYLTYQHVVCLSNIASNALYPSQAPLSEYVTDIPCPPIEQKPEGPAFIETYTVEFMRDGTPLRGSIVGRLKNNGHRFIANHGDAETLRRLSTDSEEPVGLNGRVRANPKGDGRNLFTLTDYASL